MKKKSVTTTNKTTGNSKVNKEKTQKPKRIQAEAHIPSLAKFPDENPNPVLRLTRGGEILYANPASADILKTWKRKVGQKVPKAWQGHISQVLESGGKLRVEIEAIDNYYHCTLVPLEDTDYINVYCLDVSERVRAEDEIKRSEEKFSLIFQNSPIGISISSLEDGSILDVNPAWCELMGYSRAEALGSTSPKLGMVSAAERARLDEVLRTQGTLRNFETVIQRKSGEQRPIISSLERIHLGNKPVMLGMSTDITERKQAEDAFREREAELRKAQQVAHLGSWAWHIPDNRLEWSDEMYHIFGIDRQTFTGNLPDVIASAIHPDDRERVEQSNLSVSQDKTPVPLEYRVIWADKTEHTVWAEAGELILDDKGQPLKLTGIVQDITERKQAEQALQASEVRYRRLFEAAKDGILILDAETGRILDVNPYLINILGYTRDELLEKELWQISPFRDIAANLESFQKLKQREYVRYENLPLESRSGQKLEVEFVSNVYTAGDQNVIQCNIRDITERRQAEKNIERQNKRLEALRKIDTAILSTDSIETVVHVALEHIRDLVGSRRTALILFDYNTNDAVIFEVKDDRETTSSKGTHIPMSPFEELGKILTNDQILLIDDLAKMPALPPQFQALLKDGLHSACILPLYRQDELIGTLSMFSEKQGYFDKEKIYLGREVANQVAIAITQNKLIEDLRALNAELEERVDERTVQLRHTNLELEHANRTKDEFLANMSHELRTPLNGILGMSEMLLEQRRDSLSPRQQNSLKVIESSGQHLLDLINDILDLSKIEAGKFDVYPQPVNVGDLCRSSLVFVKTQALKKSVDIAYEEDKTVSSIYVDPRRIKQILVNLLTNAVKFTSNHGQVTLRVRADVEQDLVQFSVIDTGIGINQEDLKRLFQPFTQIDSGLNRQQEGTGLGLALIQKLTDLHGGSVHVESQVGAGSSFTINLPWGRHIMEELEGIKTSDAEAAKNQDIKQSNQSVEPQERRTILLAEDNLSNVLTVGEYLEDHGYEVLVAHDGQEVVDMAEKNAPDIILMDIQMPVMDGLEATRRLRADPHFATTPIIALTALAMPGDRERCLEAGANKYLSKPVSLKGLMKTIGELLAQ